MKILAVFLLAAMVAIGAAAPAEDNDKLEDVIAQASCAAYMSHDPVGFVYAVRRDCNSEAPTCAQVCSDPKLRVQDSQTATYETWRCIGATHVYSNRPATGDGTTPALGLKQYYYGYNNCGGGGCGPNYCCCVPF
ncbi:uncharacterized protein [Dysidea avara]|uniref:uncharacterized protein isoform X2 n=1 Tax=Dysidea avara TaxID=196820 RepID=UPI00332438DB